MKTIAILQARIGSTRLPGKVLMDLGGKPMVQHIIERVKRATKVDEVVLAVPSRDTEAFLRFGIRTHLYAYPLDEADLVGRYLSAAQAYHADLIVRVPCDNPMIDPAYIDEAVETYRACDVTFHSNTTAKCNGRYIDGIGAEVFSMSRLKLIDESTAGNSYVREHPHTYFASYVLPPADIRLDVNTHADYLFIKDIYDALYPINPQFGIADILAYLETKKVRA